MRDHGHARIVGALLAAGLAGLATPAGSQVTPDTDSSAEILQALSPGEEAREAQRRFEELRRRFMPLNHAGEENDCHDRVGRVCWRHQTLSWWRGEREVPRVVEARDSLIVELARLAPALPGDEWLLGQRVWYLMEAERLGEAYTLARRCGGAPAWWCAALEGMTLHLDGDFAGAEKAYARAFRTMDAAEARRWNDVEDLLDPDAERLLERAGDRSDDDRDALLARLWWLADPLFLVPGNDRRTEHLARRTVVRIRSETRRPYGLTWGNDLAEIILRYGWVVGWERPLSGEDGQDGSVAVVLHDHADSRGFLPPAPLLADPTSVQDDPWVPSNVLARSAYAPAYAPVMLPMRSRLVVLTRGDSSLVAGTFSLPDDTTNLTLSGHWRQHRPPAALRGQRVSAGLFLQGSEDDPGRSVVEEGASAGVLKTFVPAGSYHASVEVLDPAGWRAGRLRNGVAAPRVLPDVATLSELLLLHDGPLPEDTDEALERLRAEDVIEAGEPIVVAWELWGLGWRPETVRYRLSVEKMGGGLMSDLRGLFGLIDRSTTVLEWEESGPDQPGAHLRSTSMTLSELEPGDYLLRLEMTAPGRTTVVSEIPLRVDGPAPTGDDPGT